MARRDALVSRTNAKLAYARLLWQELHDRPFWGSGDEFERAHEESILFHVVGARDAFLREIADAFRGKKHARVQRRRVLQVLQRLQANPRSWLSLAVTLRAHGTHVAGIPRNFYLGGEKHEHVYYKHPETGAEMHRPVPRFLDLTIRQMQALIKGLRTRLPTSGSEGSK